MKFYNITSSAIPGAKCTQIAIGRDAYPYGCGTIGNTQCCGSKEIWGDGYINYSFLLELLVTSECGVFLVHLNNVSGYWETLSIPTIERELNQIAPEIWKVQLKKIAYRETLMLLEILDCDKYREWRVNQLKEYS
jgi:hypothetical protein